MKLVRDRSQCDAPICICHMEEIDRAAACSLNFKEERCESCGCRFVVEIAEKKAS